MISNILDDREKRYNKVLNLLAEGVNSVACCKLNYPGKDKNTDIAKRAFEYLQDASLNTFKEYIINKEIDKGNDGCSLIISLDMEPEEAKVLAVKLEKEHLLGRIFDIDIYKDGGIPVSRSDIGSDPRKCIVCNSDNAKLCIRSGNHTVNDVLKVINNSIMVYEKMINAVDKQD